MGRKRSKRSLSAAKNLLGAKSSGVKLHQGIKANPFELLRNKKQKHKVLNKKTRGSERNVALARSLAHAKRSKQLLPELESIKKANNFADKRFGESGKALLTEEDKLLERFKRVRSKKSIYNLNEPDASITFGNSLSATIDGTKELEVTEAKEELSQEEYSEEYLDPAELMERLKSYGVGSNDASKKTKKEVMEEVIAKAKLFKAERQRIKEQDDTERNRLDGIYVEMVKGGQFSLRPSKTSPINEREIKELPKAEEEDDYERAVKELKFDTRALASTRSLTAEEIAKRERKELEEKQKELNERMKGSFEDEDDYQGRRKRRRNENPRLCSGDDEISDQLQSPMNTDESKERHNINHTIPDEEDEKAQDHETDAQQRPSKESRGELDKKDALESTPQIPYLIAAPNSHTEFLKFLGRYDSPTISTVIERIRKTNSIHLREENRKKMEKFFDVLLQHLLYLTELRARSRECNKSQEIGVLMDALFDIAHDIPAAATRAFSIQLGRKLKSLKTQLSRAASNQDQGGDYGCLSIRRRIGLDDYEKRKAGGHKGKKGKKVLEEEKEVEIEREDLYGEVESCVSDKRCWPSPGDLAFFRAISVIFPVTDFRHTIISPAQLLLGKYILSCPVRGVKDIVACVFTAQLLLEYVIDANRFAPEIFIALEVFFGQFTNTEDDSIVVEKPMNLADLLILTRLGHTYKVFPKIISLLKDKPDNEQSELDISLLRYNGEAPTSNNLWNGILKALLRIAKYSCKLAESAGIADVILKEIQAHLQKLKVQMKTEDESLQCDLNHALDCVKKSVEKSKTGRQPVKTMEAKEDAIKTHTPDYKMNYKWSQYGDETERPKIEIKKLKRELAREKKGAARELRRDAVFINEQREKERMHREELRRAERKANFSFLQNQSALFNKALRAGALISGGGSRNSKRKSQQ